MTTNKRLTREDVATESTWNLTDLFPTREDWQSELKAIQEDLDTITRFKGTLETNSNKLLGCLLEQEDILRRITSVSTYASLRQSADGTNNLNQGDTARVSDALSKVKASLSFIESEILAMSEGSIEKFVINEAGLAPFAKYLSELEEKKPHTLSTETEATLASLNALISAPYMIYNRSKLSDMQFNSFVDGNGQELPNSFALYEDNYEASPSSITRKNAYDSFIDTLKQYKHTFAATYATHVNREIVTARLRNYDSVTDMLLKEQQVTEEMYTNQLDVIQSELAPHMRRFATLKMRVLGLESLSFSDLKAPLDSNYNPEISFKDASDIILEAVEVMGEEYSSMVKTALEERWVDYADNVGKSTGAFCSSPYGVHPYILMTWSNHMRGAFTLAHELGHAGHFYLAGKNQTLTNTRPSTYFIEAPSTMNEMLLGNYLLSTTNDKQMRRWVILQLLGTYYHNFVTHLLEGEFQRRIYNLAEGGEPLTADLLSTQKAAILSEFWGDTVEIDEGASLTWMRQPHYYMGLYPYTYSAGLTVSTTVSQTIFKEGQPAVDRWLDVLKAGGTLKPKDLIDKAGVDMTKPDAIRQAVAYVGTLVDELEKSYQ